MPPVTVFEVDGQWLLADGFHRHAAAVVLGRKTLPGEVRHGRLRRGARLRRRGEPAPRAPAEPRRAPSGRRGQAPSPSRPLRPSPGRGASVGRELVAKIRRQLLEAGQIAASGTRIGADGKTYPATSQGLPRDPNEHLPRRRVVRPGRPPRPGWPRGRSRTLGRHPRPSAAGRQRGPAGRSARHATLGGRHRRCAGTRPGPADRLHRADHRGDARADDQADHGHRLLDRRPRGSPTPTEAPAATPGVSSSRPSSSWRRGLMPFGKADLGRVPRLATVAIGGIHYKSLTPLRIPPADDSEEAASCPVPGAWHCGALATALLSTTLVPQTRGAVTREEVEEGDPRTPSASSRASRTRMAPGAMPTLESGRAPPPW